MSHKVGWYIDRHVIFVHSGEVVTLDDVGRINEQVLDLMDTSNNRIHLIIDTTRIREFPLNLIKLRRHSPALDHLLIGWLVVISSNSTIRYLAQAVPQMLTRSKSQVVSTFDEAVTFIKETDRSLDWDKVNSDIVEFAGDE